jgi:protein-L-isoaspartate(D-aspartate) O-methyltransferase
MLATAAEYATARRNMVDCQIRPNDVTDLRVVDALLDVPREAFLPDSQRGMAYLDMDVPLGGTGQRFLLKPALIGRLLQAAGIAPTHKVLVVGGGTGYLAALVSRLAGEVVMSESDADMAAAAQRRFAMGGYPNIRVVHAPPVNGNVADAPFDVIVLDGAAEHIPDVLCQQLSPNGCLVGVFGTRPQRAMIVRRGPGDFGSRVLFDATAPVLPGLKQPAEFVF